MAVATGSEAAVAGAELAAAACATGDPELLSTPSRRAHGDPPASPARRQSRGRERCARFTSRRYECVAPFAALAGEAEDVAGAAGAGAGVAACTAAAGTGATAATAFFSAARFLFLPTAPCVGGSPRATACLLSDFVA